MDMETRRNLCDVNLGFGWLFSSPIFALFKGKKCWADNLANYAIGEEISGTFEEFHQLPAQARKLIIANYAIDEVISGTFEEFHQLPAQTRKLIIANYAIDEVISGTFEEFHQLPAQARKLINLSRNPNVDNKGLLVMLRRSKQANTCRRAAAPQADTRWVPTEVSGPITRATYSCDSQSIFVSFEDASVGVRNASTLRWRCRINPNSYLPANPSSRVHPLVIVHILNQFALGLNDGAIIVLAPLETEGK
ncbi:hypothetical protein CQW23_28661 [Capsicum baccatum]|uniref:Uncharacterized protein n=1 Tax=Capsicum baccatum TaxID=33114 RepID=A0A2G2VH64_CAPBA|nr:hypothetical protein CQW23_28661 [Capsicum baccatum]